MSAPDDPPPPARTPASAPPTSPSPAASTSAPSTQASTLPAAIARFAWPAAFVAVAAMGFGLVRPAPAAPAATHVVVERPTPNVVHQLRALGRLQTAALHLEKVVDVADHQTRLFGLLEAQDSLLYVASGEVVLGIDLARLGPDDAGYDRATGVARVRLPEPEVLSSRLDEVSSHVHARHTELLARRAPELEQLARQRALAAFTAAAEEPRARELARVQAARQLEALAKAWGARELVVTWRAVAPDELPVR
ncbi:MAG: DUF4230 domain-containing protein [Myxococcales bacterium]|jgi:hypothetical protein|nr:DUF4230 domain-containing protein [Myxococcales bacterium]MBL0195060.1 DUF4230 domain-containing protein [Myxococcales bacterium]